MGVGTGFMYCVPQYMNASSDNQLTVSLVRLFSASVVRDVFSLILDSVEAEADLLVSEVSVLVDDALSLLLETLLGFRLPPIFDFSCTKQRYFMTSS